MTHNSRLQSPGAFSKALYEVMKNIHPGVEDMELFEFRYALENFYPKEGGWEAVQLDSIETIESRIRLREFYASIQLKPRRGEKIVLDEQIAGLTPHAVRRAGDRGIPGGMGAFALLFRLARLLLPDPHGVF